MPELKKPERKPIVHTPVENSGQIKSYGFDAESKTVGIVFKHGPGREYQYPCSAEKFAGLENAKSKGAYVKQHFTPMKDFQRFDALPA